MSDVIIIGGGAAGMLAACVAASRGLSVKLFEKNDVLGRKLSITGKGRCNLTNDVPPDELINNMPGNPFFLYSAFYSFGSAETISFFNDIGLPTKVERGGRVFPVSDKASDVVERLEKCMKKRKVDIHIGTEIKEICVENKCVKGIRTVKGKLYPGKSVLVATGGLSYPATGSTGDGYKFARALGHTVTKLHPSLSPLRTAEKWISELQGLSLKNVAIEVKSDNKSVYKDFGEMLFTHNGVSGPIILSASRFLLGKYDKKNILSIDLKPALDAKELDKRVLRDFSKYENKDFKNALDDLLPQKMIPIVVMLSGISPTKKVHDITKEERNVLICVLKEFTLTVTDSAGFAEAVVTSGGVSVDEINPSSMCSKIINGLYFAGEVIDIDGYTGGFNLQAAFSTGFLAGSNMS